MPNRLADSTSPYLLQHAENPIDWWPWCDKAFSVARDRNVPVLLSVGYAACHWCHVMAHESFEDDSVAAYVNEHFVPIKVDREERPDVDAVYMSVTQAMTGGGGWPMTCFLTPTGQPFHCGTYYPDKPRHGMPAFRQLLAAVVKAWQTDGERVRDSARQITERLSSIPRPLPSARLDDAALRGAVDRLAGEFDELAGGFGGAPKFPPSMTLEFLLRHHERTGSTDALAMVELTGERMARSGTYDQLAGGFARYSVDAAWVVPHFEKMLYDNAQLLRVYAHLARISGSEAVAALAHRVTDATAGFLLRELRTVEGGFACALDADAAGVEGSTYVWTPEQLREVLGPEDGEWAAALLVVTSQGTFEFGSSTLQLPVDPADGARWQRVRRALLAVRASRPQPARDDKVLAAWNGLAITALSEAGAALRRPEWVAAARRAATLLLRLHVVDGRLRRSSRSGVVGDAAGVLDDHGCLAEGLLSLHQATGEARWLTAACALLDTALAHFGDDNAPGRFFDTADDAEALVNRPRDATDGASPSGASALAGALLTASALVGLEREGRYRGAAEAALASAGVIAGQYPRFAGNWLTVAEAATRGPLQVAVVGEAGDPAREALLAAARSAAPGGTVVVGGEPDAEGVPLLATRPLVSGAATAYLCRGAVCERPTTDPSALVAALQTR